jgi:protein tyrosine/serine phosphatase
MHSLKKKLITRKYKISGLSLLFLLLLWAGYSLYMNEQGNFHTITRGEAYRSAQLDTDEWEYYIRKYDIKSIVNLRGKNPEAPWYKEEMKISAEHHIEHFDIPLSATREPALKYINELVAIFRTAPRPVLIHCLAGADRSGLAAAIWKLKIDRESRVEADRQLSLLYGHLPIGPDTAMDSFFQKYSIGS